MKKIVCASAGVIGSAISGFLGGWDTAIDTLFLFMIIDYFSGVAVAGIWHKSPKTGTGSLSSVIGFKGIVKKIMMLIFVAIGHRLDILFTVDYFRLGICFAFMSNELISIVENAGLMGLPIPEFVSKAIDLLKQKGSVGHGNERV